MSVPRSVAFCFVHSLPVGCSCLLVSYLSVVCMLFALSGTWIPQKRVHFADMHSLSRIGTDSVSIQELTDVYRFKLPWLVSRTFNILLINIQTHGTLYCIGSRFKSRWVAR